MGAVGLEILLLAAAAMVRRCGDGHGLTICCVLCVVVHTPLLQMSWAWNF